MIGATTLTAADKRYSKHYLAITEKKIHTKQNKVSRNRTAPTTHANAPHFPGTHGLLAHDICDWINRA